MRPTSVIDCWNLVFLATTCTAIRFNGLPPFECFVQLLTMLMILSTACRMLALGTSRISIIGITVSSHTQTDREAKSRFARAEQVTAVCGHQRSHLLGILSEHRGLSSTQMRP